MKHWQKSPPLMAGVPLWLNGVRNLMEEVRILTEDLTSHIASLGFLTLSRMS